MALVQRWHCPIQSKSPCFSVSVLDMRRDEKTVALSNSERSLPLSNKESPLLGTRGLRQLLRSQINFISIDVVPSSPRFVALASKIQLLGLQNQELSCSNLQEYARRLVAAFETDQSCSSTGVGTVGDFRSSRQDGASMRRSCTVIESSGGGGVRGGGAGTGDGVNRFFQPGTRAVAQRLFIFIHSIDGEQVGLVLLSCLRDDRKMRGGREADNFELSFPPALIASRLFYGITGKVLLMYSKGVPTP